MCCLFFTSLCCCVLCVVVCCCCVVAVCCCVLLCCVVVVCCRLLLWFVVFVVVIVVRVGGVVVGLDHPLPDRPNFALFFPSPATIFVLFSLSCSSFSLNFGGVLFEDRDPQMCAPALQTPLKFHEKDQQEREKRITTVAGKKKKARNFGPPPFGPPPFGAPPFGAPQLRAPPFLGSGPHPPGPHPSGGETKCGQIQFWPSLVTKFGQMLTETFWKVNRQKCQKMRENKRKVKKRENKQFPERGKISLPQGKEHENAKWRGGEGWGAKCRKGGKGGGSRMDNQYSPCFCEGVAGRRPATFTQTRLMSAFRVSTGLHVEHRRPKAGDAPHEGLFEVEKLGFGRLGV